jgi:hypothetical protein
MQFFQPKQEKKLDEGNKTTGSPILVSEMDTRERTYLYRIENIR